MSSYDDNRKLPARRDSAGVDGDCEPSHQGVGVPGNSAHTDTLNGDQERVSEGIRRSGGWNDSDVEADVPNCGEDDRKLPARGDSACGDGNNETTQELTAVRTSSRINSNEDQSHTSNENGINGSEERTSLNRSEGEVALEESSIDGTKQPAACPKTDRFNRDCEKKMAMNGDLMHDASAAGPKTGGDNPYTSESSADALNKSGVKTFAGGVDNSAEGTHESNQESSRGILPPPANSYAARAARKMERAKERAKLIKGRQAGAEDTKNMNGDSGKEDHIPMSEPGDDIAAARLSATKGSPNKDGWGGDTVPLGTNDAPRIYRDSDDDTAEPPPIESSAIAPPVAVSEESYTDEEARPGAYEARGQAPFLLNATDAEHRPGAYEAAGRAPGRVPEWGRRRGIMQAIRRSITSSGSRAPAAANEASSTVPTAEAVAVDEKELENTIRRQILADAARAEVVEPKKACICGAAHCREYFRQRKKCVWLALLVVALGTVLGLSIGLTRSGATGGTADARASVLDTVIRRGMLICDINLFEAPQWFYRDLCRAIAAAVFGDPDQVRFTEISTVEDGFVQLSSGKVDVLTNGYTHTFERDFYEEFAKVGFSFSSPYLYTGLSVGGIPSYVSCADSVKKTDNCTGIPVCVVSATTWSDLVKEHVPSALVIEVPDLREAFKELKDGTCYVIAGERALISEAGARINGYEGPYKVGNIKFSNEPLALVTQKSDQRWSDLVNWVIRALFVAEEQNITQATAHLFPETNISCKGFNPTMFRNVIAAVGNYGELYERHLEGILPRESVNEINRGDSGLIYSHPFGTLRDNGPGPSKEGTLLMVKERGKLLCGVVSIDSVADCTEGSKSWRQCLDTDFCHAVAASATHSTTKDSVKTILIDAQGGFEALSKGEIDVLAGAHIDIEKDVHDSVLGVGFSFSQPYLYEPQDGHDADRTRALATRQEDTQWSDFVYWVVASTFYAEQNKISRGKSSNDMPWVGLFGDIYNRMFRDAIMAVGNYGDIYVRNLNLTIPRSGRNNLNNISQLGPQHFPLPFSSA